MGITYIKTEGGCRWPEEGKLLARELAHFLLISKASPVEGEALSRHGQGVCRTESAYSLFENACFLIAMIFAGSGDTNSVV